MNRVAVGLLLIALAAPGRAADLPKELASVPNDALGFASVNAAEAAKHPALRGQWDSLLKSGAAASYKKATGLELSDLARATVVVPVPAIEPGVRRVPEPEPLILLTSAKPLDAAAILKAGEYYSIDEAKALVGRRAPGEKLPPPSGKVGASHYVNRQQMILAFVDDRTLVLSPVRNFDVKAENAPNPKDLLKSAEATGQLSDGIALAATKPLAFSLNMSGVRRIAEVEPVPNEAASLLKADSVVGSVTLEKDAAKLHVVAGFAGKQWAADAQETATALKTLAALGLGEEVKRMRRMEGDDSAMAKVLVLLAKTMNAATVKQADNDVTVAATFDLGAESAKLLADLPGTASDAAIRSISSNNLKQIGLGFHSYHDANNRLASNTYDKAGKPLLSWRVHILPQMEQNELYKEFKLDEPWDSENNKKLIAKMPVFYSLPGVKTEKPGMTHYRSFISPMKRNSIRAIMMEQNTPASSFAWVTDGLSNSFLCIEADDACVWTEPNDIPFDPKGKVAIKGGLLVKDRFQALFGDGTVRSLSAKMPEATLKAYITINGGEVIDDR